jgi:hypothetical protein
MYIWADKYVYQPGEQLTLKWTAKTSDPYSYTVVAFRQNNQTGRKSYFGANKSGDTPVDIFGKSPDQGFQAQSLADAARDVLIGAGGSLLSAPFAIPNELGMHTFTVQLRDETGCRVLKAAYFKIGVVDQFVDVSGVISQDTN